jgi:hypothetical protein
LQLSIPWRVIAFCCAPPGRTASAFDSKGGKPRHARDRAPSQLFHANFAEGDFIEVETPFRVPAPGVGAHVGVAEPFVFRVLARQLRPRQFSFECACLRREGD